MRIYDYMKGILGAMGVGEDVGVPEPSWRIEEYLKAIYDKLKEGGGLPGVTPSDNGKVLAVKNGAWAADSNLFLVTVENNTSDKTHTEIVDAINQGKTVVMKNGDYYMHYIRHDIHSVVFCREIISGDGNTKYIKFDFVSASGNGKTTGGASAYLLPSISNADNGKVLKAANSAWVKAELLRADDDNKQVIPIEFNGLTFAPQITPEQLETGYTLTYEQGGETRTATFPAFQKSSYTICMLYMTGDQWVDGYRFMLNPDYTNVDGVTFHSPIAALDGIGLTGYVGVLTVEPYNGHNSNYDATLHYWLDAGANQ